MIQLMHSERAYSRYRAHILKQSPPIVPYLGVYLTDLTFVEDGNQNTIITKRTGRTLINWKKRKFVFDIIQKIQVYQDKPYDIFPVYQIQKVIESTLKEEFSDDPTLYKISLLREPRNVTNVKDLVD
jgi:hypothetical protein